MLCGDFEVSTFGYKTLYDRGKKGGGQLVFWFGGFSFRKLDLRVCVQQDFLDTPSPPPDFNE